MKVTYTDSLGTSTGGSPAVGSPAVKLSVYPNPCHSLLHISSPFQISRIRLLTLTGQVVVEHFDLSCNLHILDLSQKQKGLYLLEVKDKAGIPSTTRIILL